MVAQVDDTRPGLSAGGGVAQFTVPLDGASSAPEVTAGFREVFGSHPAGVAIITARGEEGPVGLTASSVTSVSADPAIIAFSLQAARGSAGQVVQADTLLVHLLDERNADLARAFAVSGAPRFGDVMSWEQLPTGEPLLHGVGRVLRVAPLAKIHAGPAIVFNAAVVDVVGSTAVGAPLVYHQRRFHALDDRSALSE